jgi:hypothetical protein
MKKHLLLILILFFNIKFEKKANAQCEKPEITAIRQSGALVCTPLVESLNFTYDTLYPDTQITLNWGDGTPNVIYNYEQILGDSATHTYLKSSCGVDAYLNEIFICADCFVISYTAVRKGCFNPVPSFSTASSYVEVYSKPVVFFDYKDDIDVTADTALLTFNVCKTDSVKATNQSSRNNGSGCMASSDAVEWSYAGISNAFTFTDTYTCDSTECDSIYAFTFPEVGKYAVSLSQQNNCGLSQFTDTLYVRPTPQVGFETDNFYDCYPADITFINNSDTTILNTTWIFITGIDTTRIQADTLITNAQELYLNEGQFTIVLQGKDAYCQNDADTTLVFDLLCEDLYVPNAFIPDSPDPDLNTFRPVAINLIKYRINIYNLHGKLIWTSDKLNNGAPAEGWDGTFRGESCPQGAYVWKIEATLNDGYTENGIPWKGQKLETSEKRTVGTVSILR